MVDTISYVQGSTQTLVINYSLPTHFIYLSQQEVVGLEGHIGLPAMQPVQYLVPPGFVWAERGMGALYIGIPGL